MLVGVAMAGARLCVIMVCALSPMGLMVVVILGVWCVAAESRVISV